jgi:hypothetical protein
MVCLSLEGLADLRKIPACLVEREALRDLNAEGAGLGQSIELVKDLPIRRSVVSKSLNAGSALGFWLYSVRVGHPP